MENQILIDGKKPKKMNPLVKEMWVKALRSGDYKQTTGQLRYVSSNRTLKGFCCLGVLCDISGFHDWPDLSNPHDRGNLLYSPEEVKTGDLLPLDVKGWAELEDGIGPKLAVFNDAGWTFEQIADIIEEEL